MSRLNRLHFLGTAATIVVAGPLGLSGFVERPNAMPETVAQTVSDGWTELAFHKLIYYNRASAGGHFAAWEQPQVFSEEVRAGFRPLRK